ncbi:hypothetical protein [Rhodococcus chondri]|uniref:Uncharacterized protein n=1 Tax=Rhodococcus chondri TaxID=3065941 RepID=A0ABU7JXF8_9NOCA|nr:hypothetical protein [Rhodococcus sp. CC-R104]MEE2034199.1 hypothetical protein [Rhodococcus sp. CC-R104]
MPSAVRTTLVLLSVTVSAALTWVAWLGWESGYRRLPDGRVEGPYSPAQVVACAATLIAIVVLGCLAVRCATGPAGAVVACATAGFAFAWGRDAAAADETGLWGVGLLLLVVGCSVGGTAVAVVTALASRWMRRFRP